LNGAHCFRISSRNRYDAPTAPTSRVYYNSAHIHIVVLFFLSCSSRTVLLRSYTTTGRYDYQCRNTRDRIETFVRTPKTILRVRYRRTANVVWKSTRIIHASRPVFAMTFSTGYAVMLQYHDDSSTSHGPDSRPRPAVYTMSTPDGLTTPYSRDNATI